MHDLYMWQITLYEPHTMKNIASDLIGRSNFLEWIAVWKRRNIIQQIRVYDWRFMWKIVGLIKNKLRRISISLGQILPMKKFNVPQSMVRLKLCFSCMPKSLRPLENLEILLISATAQILLIYDSILKPKLLLKSSHSLKYLSKLTQNSWKNHHEKVHTKVFQNIFQRIL